jgi:hypothetical protein
LWETQHQPKGLREIIIFSHNIQPGTDFRERAHVFFLSRKKRRRADNHHGAVCPCVFLQRERREKRGKEAGRVDGRRL